MSTWIDLTDLLRWNGNLTGIQRVQFNISKLYINSGKDVRFFEYKERSKEFVEINFDPDELVKSGMISGNPKKKKSIYRGVLRRVRLLNLEQTTRRRLSKILIQLERRLYPSVKTPFRSDDTVLVLGSVWTGSFIDDLHRAKTVDQFCLLHFAFDMIPSKLPGFVVPWLPKVFTKYYIKAIGASDGIICISESTASDVREFIEKHNIKKSPEITVVRIGESIEDTRESAIRKIEPGYILSVSTIEARKNHWALFYLLREAHSRGIKIPKIVIVGRIGWHTDDLRYMLNHDPIARKGIVVLNDIDDAKLTWLYRNCLFTVSPSFYEGWGMPIAESLAYGKLCLASKSSSMTEIAGTLIEYFSPYDTGELVNLVTKYLDLGVLKAKEEQIRATYKPTSWDSMFQQVVDFATKIKEVSS